METNFKNNLAPAVIELNKMNDELQAENARLKKEVADYHQLQWQHDALIDENEKLKAELKKWEDRSKVVKDGYDGEVYEWEDNRYIVTPHLNVFVKGLLKENAKLKCLALHAMSEYFDTMFLLNSWREDYYGEAKYLHLMMRYDKLAKQYDSAFCKAKTKLMEGK